MPFLQPSSSFFKAEIVEQTEEKSCGKMKSREGNKSPRGELGCHGRGSHHDLTVVASGRHGLTSLLRCVLVHLFDPRVLPWISCLGPIGLVFASSYDLVWHQLIYFLLTLGLIHINLQSKSKQVETKRNRRNMGINCKTMQINLYK